MKSCLDISSCHHITAPWSRSEDHKRAQAENLDFLARLSTSSIVPHDRRVALAWNQHPQPRAGPTHGLFIQQHAVSFPGSWKTILNPDSAAQTTSLSLGHGQHHYSDLQETLNITRGQGVQRKPCEMLKDHCFCISREDRDRSAASSNEFTWGGLLLE